MRVWHLPRGLQSNGEDQTLGQLIPTAEPLGHVGVDREGNAWHSRPDLLQEEKIVVPAQQRTGDAAKHCGVQPGPSMLALGSLGYLWLFLLPSG